MNPNENAEITVKTLLALRQETDALQLITEKLRVKAMGPSDHIRTKHEAKTFLETGKVSAAEMLIKQAQVRIAANQAATNRISQRQQQERRME